MRIIPCIWLALTLHAAAGLQFPETHKEVHAPADADRVTVEFDFTNDGDAPLAIRKYHSGCSCIGLRVKDEKMRYAPGESGVLHADFKLGNYSGTVDKMIALWLEDDPESQPSMRLTVRVHIPVLVEIEPKTLTWNLNGDAAPQVIRIRMKEGHPAGIANVSSSSPVFKTELKTIEDRKNYELWVTPERTSTAGLGVLRIETDHTSPKHRLHQAFAVVRRPAPGEAAAKP
jgi:hypothetical protein